MTARYISDSEIAHHQETIRLAARQARHDSTISNIRQVIGSMLISIGEYLQGSMEKRSTATMPTPVMPDARSA